jgi:NAD(P) transhydrogenase subunit alpha
MFGNNLFNYLKLIVDENGELNLNFEDEIIKGSCVTHNGQIVNEKMKSQ